MRPMIKTFGVVLGPELLITLVIQISSQPASAQLIPPMVAKPLAPGLLKLTGEEANRAGELDKAIEAALKADRWDEAIARADELAVLRAKVQGPKHFEAVNADWLLKTLRRVAAMPKPDRGAFLGSGDAILNSRVPGTTYLLSRPAFAGSARSPKRG
jgi:hypothetical protein